jgi:glutathione S-transferase
LSSQCQDKFCGLVDFSAYPRVQRWMAATEELPHFAKIHAPLEKLGAAMRKRKSKM